MWKILWEFGSRRLVLVVLASNIFVQISELGLLLFNHLLDGFLLFFQIKELGSNLAIDVRQAIIFSLDE